MLPLKASIYASYATLVPDWSYLPNRTHKGLNLQNRASNQNQHYGDLSKKAKKRIENAIKWLVIQAKIKKIRDRETGKDFRFRVNFVTLTLPGGMQIESDQYIKANYLNQFLTECRRYTKMKNYIWKSEPQANGAIHFHITTDAFIHWKMIRNTWNRILDKGDYLQNYRKNQMEWHKDGFKPRPELFKHWPLDQQKKAYEIGLKEDWKCPNSTDVHSVKNIKDLPAYLAKYMAKSDESRRAMQGRIWGCSERLSKVGRLKFCLDSYDREFDMMKFRAGCELKELEHCELLMYSSKDLLNRSTGNLATVIELVINYLRHEFGVTWDMVEQAAGSIKINNVTDTSLDFEPDIAIDNQTYLEDLFSDL